MNLMAELKSLVNGGAKTIAAPAPAAAVVETPAPVATSTPAVESTPAPEAVTVAPEQVIIAQEPAVVSSLPEALPAGALDEFGEEIERPVDLAEEADETIHVHSRQRIAFLLRTYEKDRLDLTQKRIAVDKARHAHVHPQDFSQKPQPSVVPGNPQLFLRSS